MRAGALHALPAVRAQRLGAAAEVRRRRLPRRRQGDVRRRGQPLGRQQLHRRLAGQRRAVAGQRQQVRPQRQAAVADHHRLHRRRHAGRHLRRGDRPEGQRLAVELRQQVHHRVRQGRQAADAAGRHQLRRPARPDAGHHHRAQRRRVGAGRLQAAAAALPQGRLEQRPHRLRGRQRRALQVLHRAVPPGHRPAGPHLGLGQLVPRHPLPGGRPEPRP